MNILQKYTPHILATISIVVIWLVFQFCKPIAQNTDYHHFAHEFSLVNIDNCSNVISNLGFIIIGIGGLVKLIKSKNNNIIYYGLVTGILLTGFGSGYYHYNPNNETLVWDRIPMTIIFASFFASIYSYYISKKWANVIWLVAICIGIFSVLYWNYTEKMGNGDLRLYAIVQLLPMLLIAIILSLNCNSNKNIFKPITYILVWYVIAKLFEHFDHQLFEHTNFISGHPIKHIAASISTFFMIKLIHLNNFKNESEAENY